MAYQAAIDIRDSKPPADKVIRVKDGTAGSVDVSVQCRISARLDPIGTNLEVEPSGGEWLTKEFTPTGVVIWTWSVKVLEPVDQQLKLTILPAVLSDKSVANLYAADDAAELVVLTDVQPNATLLERISYWVRTQAVIVGIIAVALVGILVGILAQLEIVKRAFRRLLGRT